MSATFRNDEEERVPETLLLTRADVVALLPLDLCIAAVEDAFRRLGRGEAEPPATFGIPSGRGGFHVKAGILQRGSRRYFAAKVNGNFPDNPVRAGLPTIQGVVALCDADAGSVLAVMDSVALTALRTAAATAVAARHLARPDAAVAAICGCGVQGRIQLRALAEVLPLLRRVHVYDASVEQARAYASEMTAALGLPIVVEHDIARALAVADVCVTCTTATDFLIQPEFLHPGTFIAGVGVDDERKRELAPAVLAAASKIVTDLRSQCAVIGDLHHALDAGVVTLSAVHADLGDVVAGFRAGRETDDELIVFDSTGLALQDVAAAAAVYELALAPAAGASPVAPRRLVFA